MARGYLELGHGFKPEARASGRAGNAPRRIFSDSTRSLGVNNALWRGSAVILLQAAGWALNFPAVPAQ